MPRFPASTVPTTLTAVGTPTQGCIALSWLPSTVSYLFWEAQGSDPSMPLPYEVPQAFENDATSHQCLPALPAGTQRFTVSVSSFYDCSTQPCIDQWEEVA